MPTAKWKNNKNAKSWQNFIARGNFDTLVRIQHINNFFYERRYIAVLIKKINYSPFVEVWSFINLKRFPDPLLRNRKLIKWKNKNLL